MRIGVLTAVATAIAIGAIVVGGGGGGSISPPATCARIFYVDFAGGNDANNGTSTGTPWKYAPGMDGFTGTYTHQNNGDCFVFKGGVTWTLTQASPPYWNVANGGPSGADPDWYGVDTSWYTGGSWTKPIFDFTAGGSISDGGGSGVWLITADVSNVTIADIEFKGMHYDSTGWHGLFHSGTHSVSNLILKDWYCHGWSQPTGDENYCVVGDTDSFGANPTFPGTNTIIDGLHCNGADSTTGTGICAYGSWETVKNSITENNCGGLGKIVSKYVYGNEFGNTDACQAGGHENNLYWSPPGGCTDCAAYNNTVHDNATEPLYVTLEQIAASTSTTIKIYNNVVYNAATRGIEIDPDGAVGAGQRGDIYIYNNTIEMDDGTVPITLGARGSNCANVVNIRNNHGITTNGSLVSNGMGCGTVNTDHNVLQTPTNATSQGYVLGNLFAPDDNGDATVNVGTDLSATIPAVDRLGVTRPQGGTWDAGAYERG